MKRFMCDSDLDLGVSKISGALQIPTTAKTLHRCFIFFGGFNPFLPKRREYFSLQGVFCGISANSAFGDESTDKLYLGLS